jgi:hypothetical protein
MSTYNAPNDAKSQQSQHGVAQIKVHRHGKVTVITGDDQAQNAKGKQYVE